jgi:hypothetical protein
LGFKEIPSHSALPSLISETSFIYSQMDCQRAPKGSPQRIKIYRRFMVCEEIASCSSLEVQSDRLQRSGKRVKNEGCLFNLFQEWGVEGGG